MRRLVLAALAAFAAPAAAAAPTYAVVGQIAGADGGWDTLSVDPVHHRLYVARSDAIMAVDLATGHVTDKLAPAERAHAALAIPGTSEVISTNGNANTAVIFDGGTGQVRATIPTGKRPDAAAYDPATRTVWVMTPGDGNITVIDPRSAKAVATVQVGGSLEFGVADGKGRLYVNVEDKNEIAVIDTRRHTVLAREPLPGCDGPSGIVYVPRLRETVSACGNGVADVLSSSGKLVATVPVGRGPDGAEYDSRRNIVLVPSGREGELYAISMSGTPHVVAKVATAKSARTIALDPSTGRADLPAVDQLPPAAPGQRPQAKPGTFRIIVVAPSA
jgi:DNA-binding beta-propeller fold protein YncE